MIKPMVVGLEDDATLSDGFYIFILFIYLIRYLQSITVELVLRLVYIG